MVRAGNVRGSRSCSVRSGLCLPCDRDDRVSIPSCELVALREVAGVLGTAVLAFDVDAWFSRPGRNGGRTTPVDGVSREPGELTAGGAWRACLPRGVSGAGGLERILPG